MSEENFTKEVKRRTSISAPTSPIPRVPSMSETEGTDEGSSNNSSGGRSGGDDCIEILGELVGASDLVADEHDEPLDACPYCVVHFGDRKIHWSEPAEGLSPVWTIETDSLFLLRAAPEELAHSPLTFTLWTKRKLGLAVQKTFLGRVCLPADKILKRCNGERFEIPVEDEVGDDSGMRGDLFLRLRLATPSDSKFVRLWNSSIVRDKKILKALLDKEDKAVDKQLATIVTETDESKVAGASFINALTAAFTVSPFYGTRGASKRRVKPHGDPKRLRETQYMYSHELKLETRKPSENWVEAGSGKLGKVYVEVLSCHDLPNVDVGEAVGNVTDSFVSLVFEDAFVQTPVIDDELSPHWLPWTQRAFCFGMMHPTSHLYIGVFDYDLGPLVEHQPLGRIAINICNFQPDTLYTLKYDLFKSANVTDRTPQGQITIRLRVEVFDEKAALMAALQPRPNIHVNVRKKKSFKVVRYTCFGEYDGEDKFDLAVSRSYVGEIFEYKRHLEYTMGDSLRSLIFWRGQVEVCSFFLPIHSFLFFLVTSTLVERPQLLPSILILCVPWIMIANGRKRRQHPSPWHRVPTTFQYLDILLNGKSTRKIRKICSNQGYDEAVKYEAEFVKREQEDLKKAEMRAEMQAELNDVGDESIHTEVKLGIPIDLLKRLGRWQGYLGTVCRFLRQIKIVLLWEESMLSFWITAVSLAVGIVSLLLPWCFILTWTGRIVVYGFFGPHMMIVDLYLRANKSDDFRALVEQFDQKKKAARLRREQALKFKSVKCLRFGKFITQVPSFNLARHHDRPLPYSTAKLLKKLPTVQFTAYLPGQQLYGEMLPRLVDGYTSNQKLALERMQQVSALETRLLVLRAAAKLGGGVRYRRLLRLKSNEAEEEQPPEVGYELVQSAGQSLTQLQLPTEAEWMTPRMTQDTCNLDGMNLCVVSYDGNTVETFEESADEGPLSLDLIITEDATETFDISANMKVNNQDRCGTEYGSGEEGIEIVAWGRFNPSESHDEASDTHEENVLGNASRTGIGGGLSLLYRSSDSTFVAFYRP